MIAYKQFRIDKSGNLHPLFVFHQDIVPIGKWLIAKAGERTGNGKVSSKLGPLAYRPGWHLSEMPYAPHIGLKENGKVKYMHPDTVWAECEVYDEVDYTADAISRGINSRTGAFDARKACLDCMPVGGFYWYNTNMNAYGHWLIAERIRVNRVLTDAEVETICYEEFGIHAQERKVG